jgi:FdrA protein
MSEVIRTIVWKSFYRDSVTLMRLASELQDVAQISSVAALMATPANLEMLLEAGFERPKEATNGADLVLAIRGESTQAIETGIREAQRFFERRAPTAGARHRPRTLDAALALDPDASLALISVPGEYAAREARRALNAGLHVFLFSDNVSVDDEVALKRQALDLGLLCLGPDCGTAYLDGVGLGFANAISRGPVGCVAASGTGLQAIGSYLAARGIGLSQGIGVGGRDLVASVGGLMTMAALERLGADPTTSVIVLVAKSVAAAIGTRLDTEIRRTGKPVICCFLDPDAPRLMHAAFTTNRLDHAAAAAAAVSDGRSPTDGIADIDRGEAVVPPLATRSRGRSLLGLFSGGTLAAEAIVVLRERLDARIQSNADKADSSSRHRILDLGADEFTRGRPHPMIDTRLRGTLIREAGRDLTVGVVLLDLVLGRGAHPDPATPLSGAVIDARRSANQKGRDLLFVASVIGTTDDRQNLSKQVRTLRKAGVIVAATSASAAELAGRLSVSAPRA